MKYKVSFRPKHTFTCDNNLFLLTGVFFFALTKFFFLMVTYNYLSHDSVTCDVDHDLFFKARVFVFLAPVYCVISQV